MLSRDELEQLLKRHALALEELQRFRSIFESITSGITIADANLPDLPLTYVNPAFERMTGYSAREAQGQNCRFLQGTDRDQPGRVTIQQAIQMSREARVVLRNYRKDGTPFWNDIHISPLFGPNGNLTHFVGVQNDITARIESSERLQHMADHDSLTGLVNRGCLLSRLEDTLTLARHSSTSVAVLFFDLDHFKKVNDVLGHGAGDDFLQIVAARLSSVVRKGETVARLGGDEFVVVLENISSDRHPFDVVRRLLDRLGEAMQVMGSNFYPSASVGVAIFPEDGNSPETLLKVADFKMYVDKHSTRFLQEVRGESAHTPIGHEKQYLLLHPRLRELAVPLLLPEALPPLLPLLPVVPFVGT